MFVSAVGCMKIKINEVTYAKQPLVRPKHRWEDNVKMDLKETGRESAY
jgi:hypothetical protein